MFGCCCCCCRCCRQSLIKEQSVRGHDNSVVQLHMMPQSSCPIPDALYMLDDRTCPLLHHHQLLHQQQQQQQSAPRGPASSSTVDIIAGTIPGLCCYFVHFIQLTVIYGPLCTLVHATLHRQLMTVITVFRYDVQCLTFQPILSAKPLPSP